MVTQKRHGLKALGVRTQLKYLELPGDQSSAVVYTKYKSSGGKDVFFPRGIIQNERQYLCLCIAMRAFVSIDSVSSSSRTGDVLW